MKNHSLVLTQPGVYFFRAPAKLTLFVGRELLITLSAPVTHAYGLLLFEVDSPIRNLEDSLDRLTTKMVMELGIKKEDLKAKIFGMAHHRASVEKALDRWLNKHEIELVAADTGRNTRREVSIDCNEPKIGVKYAVESKGIPEFLSGGSARLRANSIVPSSLVLVLTQNPVTRLLAQQAIEENEGCVASAPQDPKKFIANKEYNVAPYTHVLVFEDLALVTAAKSFIKKSKILLPSSLWYWIGKEQPKEMHFLPLPRLSPENPLPFKKELGKVLAAHNAKLPDPSHIISFPKPKRKRTG